MDQIINSFAVRKTLNEDFWTGFDSGIADQTKLKPEIRTKLLEIAEAFVDSFGLEGLEVEDVLFLGSLSGFNWSKFSDVDLHILIDKSKIDADETFINEFFDAKKGQFNDSHDITIKGYEVELYVQGTEEPNAANGVYSVLYAKWEKFPETEDPDIDKDAIIRKVKEFNKQLRKVKNMADSQGKLTKLNNLKEKIGKYRKAGLADNGEYATENLVFKYLRRSGFMEEIFDIKYSTWDKLLSLQEGTFK